MNQLSENIRQQLLDSGANLVGFAELSEIPAIPRRNFRFGISIGIALSPHIVRSIKKGPNKDYYEEYLRLNDQLNRMSSELAARLKELGIRAEANTTTEVRVNRTEISTELPHKTVATRAGLGWIGKNALLITPEYGSAVRLTTVLTDAELAAGKPINESGCGNCRICQSVCTGNAIKGVNWNIGLQRDEYYNAENCKNEALRLSGLQGINESICGICIASCPYTLRYIANA